MKKRKFLLIPMIAVLSLFLNYTSSLALTKTYSSSFKVVGTYTDGYMVWPFAVGATVGITNYYNSVLPNRVIYYHYMGGVIQNKYSYPFPQDVTISKLSYYNNGSWLTDVSLNRTPGAIVSPSDAPWGRENNTTTVYLNNVSGPDSVKGTPVWNSPGATTIPTAYSKTFTMSY